MVVEGGTTLVPDDNSAALTTTDEWSIDGTYVVTLQLEAVQRRPFALSRQGYISVQP